MGHPNRRDAGFCGSANLLCTQQRFIVKLSLLFAAFFGLAATSVHGEQRRAYRACAEAHVSQFVVGRLSPEEVAGQIIDLHCTVEAIEFAQALARAQGGDARDNALFETQLLLLREDIVAAIRQLRGG